MVGDSGLHSSNHVFLFNYMALELMLKTAGFGKRKLAEVSEVCVMRERSKSTCNQIMGSRIVRALWIIIVKDT